MFNVITLTLALTAADPALVGAVHDAPPPPAATVLIQTPCLSRSQSVAACNTRSVIGHHASTAPRHTRATSTHNTHATRRTVNLNDGFFAGGLTGGVEARHAPIHVYGHVYGHRVVIVGGHAAPRSAGQAAAARGLGRAGH